MREEDILALIEKTPLQRRILDAVYELQLPDWWIGAGSVRNLVWDTLYGEGKSTPLNDVDIVYFKPLSAYGMQESALIALIKEQKPNPVWEEEKNLAEKLAPQFPGIEFEVKNQARMHLSLARTLPHLPYTSAANAIGDWIETATCVGVRKEQDGALKFLACYGIDDLVNGIVRPTRKEYTERAKERAKAKRWFELWPKLRFENA